MFRIHDDVPWWPIPIVVVDDDDRARTQYVEFISRAHPNRSVAAFGSLADARAELFRSSRPFGLILDHNMKKETEHGARLARDLRTQHPWGLALPIAYYSAYCTPDDWAEICRDMGSLGPTMLYSKSVSDNNVLRIVSEIDKQFEQTCPVFLASVKTILENSNNFDLWETALEYD